MTDRDKQKFNQCESSIREIHAHPLLRMANECCSKRARERFYNISHSVYMLKNTLTLKILCCIHSMSIVKHRRQRKLLVRSIVVNLHNGATSHTHIGTNTRTYTAKNIQILCVFRNSFEILARFKPQPSSPNARSIVFIVNAVLLSVAFCIIMDGKTHSCAKAYHFTDKCAYTLTRREQIYDQ